VNRLPPWLVGAIAAVVAVLLAYNVYADINVKGYDGYGTTLILAGILGGLLGLHRKVVGRDDDR
jgi:MFS superfamily sulfate permease-like transporter